MFGFGRGRIVSRYPKKWRSLVWEAFGARGSEIEQKRIETLLTQLLTPEVRRQDHVWNAGQDWLANAETEHARRPFHAILARQNPRARAEVLVADDVLEGTPPAWNAPASLLVARTAAAMAQCVTPMLRAATRVLFIDPHFRASRARCRNPLAAWLREIPGGATIELHAANATDNAPDWTYFRTECENGLPGILMPGTEIAVRRWKNRAGGEMLHNRYILTDVGGVQFGVGLDEGDQGTTDDVALLEANVFNRRFQDFAGPAYAFDIDGQVTIPAAG
jgi:hypothetical protein